MLRSLFTGKATSTRVEFIRFLPISGVTSLIDFSILIILTEFLHIHYLISAAAGFVAGQIWSYRMSVLWVFARVSETRRGFLPFLTLSTVGLIFMELMLWTLTEYADQHYLISKVISSALAFLVLFSFRKRLLFS